MADADPTALDAAHDGAGHRARLRRRLASGGGDALLDHELVEYLLALAIPRRDTKPLAKQLLREFGGVAGVLAADTHALAAQPGMGETSVAAIKIAHAAAVRLLQARTERRDVLGNWQALLDYLRARLAHEAVEHVRVLHLDTKNALIQDEQMSRGSIDQAAVYVREVVARALHFGSAAVILAHNHPSGDPQPSRADIEITRAIAAAGKPLGIAVHDHVVVGRHGHVSLRAQGLI